jgi:hypothetical protein
VSDATALRWPRLAVLRLRSNQLVVRTDRHGCGTHAHRRTYRGQRDSPGRRAGFALSGAWRRVGMTAESGAGMNPSSSAARGLPRRIRVRVPVADLGIVTKADEAPGLRHQDCFTVRAS